MPFGIPSLYYNSGNMREYGCYLPGKFILIKKSFAHLPPPKN